MDKKLISYSDHIYSIGLSNRSAKALSNIGCITVRDFIALKKNDLSIIKGLGKKSINEILKLQNDVMKLTGECSFVTMPKIENKLYFKYGNEYIENKHIDELKFSDELKELLKKYECLFVSDLYNYFVNSKTKINGFSNDNVNIIISELATQKKYLQIDTELEKYTNIECFLCSNAIFIDIPFLHLVNICKQYYKKENISYFEFAYDIFQNSRIYNIILDKVIKIIKDNPNESIIITDLIASLPRDVVNTNIFKQIINDLHSQKKITVSEDLITLKYVKLNDYLKTLPDERNINIVKLKLQGNTLEEIGNIYNITRERTRQIINKVLKTFPKLDENKYTDIFNKYVFTKESFCKSFEEAEEVYEYLLLITPVVKEKLKFDDILKDEHISKSIKRNVTKLIYKDYVKINNIYVLKRRPEIVNFILKKYCKRMINFYDFLELYKRITTSLNLTQEEFDNIKIDVNYANRICDNKNVLWVNHKNFRYYPIEEYEIQELYQNINFNKYLNMEISTLKIFRDNKRLMKEFNLNDEYELHNFLRKTWNEYGPNVKADMSRMPGIVLGTADRNKQVMDLFIKNAPIKYNDFIELYEDVYGFRKETVSANFIKCIKKYLNNGIYQIELKDFSANEITFLTDFLKNDFYTIEDIKNILIRKFPEFDERKLNAYNFKRLGYSSHSDYIISKKYSSVSDFFMHYLLSMEIVDESRINDKISSISSFQTVLNNLVETKKLYDFAPGAYINISRLNKLGISSVLLDEYIKSIENITSDVEYFSIASLPNGKEKEKIDKLLGFSDDTYFYDALITREKSKFMSLNIGNGHIFKKGNSEFTLEDFIRYILKDESCMYIHDIIREVKHKYKLELTLKRLHKLVSDSDFYFTNNYIFINYEKYLEEF